MKTQTLSDGEISVTLQMGDRECTVRTGTADPKEAKALIKACNLDTIESLGRAEKLTASLIRKLTIGGTKTVRNAIEEWQGWITATANSDLTSSAYKRNVDAWYYFTTPDRLMDVQEQTLSDWVNQDDGTKASTRAIRVASLRSFFGYCADKQYLEPDPSLTVRIRMKNLTHEQKETRKRTPYTDEEVIKLTNFIWTSICDITRKRMPKYYETAKLSKLSFWAAAVRIARVTGLRLGDICCLQWACFTDKTMTVWTDKADKRIEFPLTGDLREATSYIPPSGGAYCFPAQQKVSCDPLQRHKLCIEFGSLVKRAGLPPHSFHEFRHTKATELFQAGVELIRISELLGHSSIEVTQGYIHPEFKGIGPATLEE